MTCPTHLGWAVYIASAVCDEHPDCLQLWHGCAAGCSSDRVHQTAEQLQALAESAD